MATLYELSKVTSIFSMLMHLNHWYHHSAMLSFA